MKNIAIIALAGAAFVVVSCSQQQVQPMAPTVTIQKGK